jgi:cell wall-associated NlpC family hydrolase
VKTRRPLIATLFLPMMVAAAFAMSACMPATAAAGTTAGQAAVTAARTQIGQPYVYGGASPAAGGFDCSGLTLWAWQQAGVRTMPRTAIAQAQWATPITKAELQAGDLIFYSADGPTGSVSHVALYSGQDTQIQALKPGVKLDEYAMTYWADHVVGYGRVPVSALPTT